MTHSGPNIIGGMFGLDTTFTPIPCAAAPFIEPGSLLLANARSGIHILVKELKPARVWMPSYLCGAMLQGVGASPVHFYPVDSNLGVSDLASVAERDLVVVIDYFGFPAPAGLIEEARSRGAWVLEDACQALLTAEAGIRSDFVLFSPRKFLGVPEGGVLTSHKDFSVGGLTLEDPPAGWALKALEAVLLRRDFDLYGVERRWFTVFKELEQECPVGYFQMSGVAKTLLLHSFDYNAIAQRRRDNYLRLSERLAGIAVFPTLPSGVVPLGFPVRLPARDRVRQELFAAEIFPPIHWPISDIVPSQFAGSHQLSREIMTLPCDQRYAPPDMDRIADLVLRAIER